MNKQEVLENAIRYFNGDDLAANVWLDKYCLKNKDNFVETDPSETIERLAGELYRIELNYPNPTSHKDIFNLLNKYHKFVLGGSPLFGVGNNTTLSTLGSCFVIESPEDSYGGIFRADQELAQLMKRRGGVGIDISTLRAKKAHVNNAASSSTGAVSFMHRYSNTTREVAQEGRRGALMITMNIDHPDIEEFIVAKDDLTKVTGANISVKVTDKFMESVKNHDYFTKESFGGQFTKAIKSKELWDKLIHQAWKSAEPGVLFWDRIIENSPADCYPQFKTITTNPCSELPLCAYDSCRLSAINIYAYVDDPFTNKASFNEKEFIKDVRIAQRMMDNLVDLEAEKIKAILTKIISDPEDMSIKKVEFEVWKKILEKLKLGRRTGLGQMGLADAGAALGYKYGSNEFNRFGEYVNKVLAIESYTSSIIMAEERGAFPVWRGEYEEDNPYIKKIFAELGSKYQDKFIKYGRRNIANLTIAPTGSISILAQCSSGIEPVFALSYKRKRKVTDDHPNKSFQDKQGDWWEEYDVYHSKWEKWRDLYLVDENANISDPYYQATAHNIDPYTKLRLQAYIQPWIDHSISVTYNLPETVTEKEVSDIYMKAWEFGLKGMTVYREGSRDGVLTTHKKKVEFNQHDAPKRPKVLPHDVYSIMSKGHHWMVSVGVLEGKPYEVFAFNNVEISGTRFVGEMSKLAKGRYDLSIPSENRVFQNITNGCSDEENLLTRMISTSLRHGADIKFVVDQLNKSEGDITSFGKAISRVLKRYIPDGVKAASLCPECGTPLVYEGGCYICKECGASKCE